MDIVDIDTAKLKTLGEDLIAVSKNLDAYITSFEDYVTKMQRNEVWKGKSSTSFRELSELDIVHYKDYSKAINDLGKVINNEANALEEEIASLKDV